MSTVDTQSKKTTVLLLGNPNVGKTTLFNRLCGLRSATANFPGSTVAARSGTCTRGSVARSFIDLPGTYSLHTNDDLSKVCSQAIKGVDGTPPDAVLVIADATNLRRNLTLVHELLHYDIPCVVALSMVDIAQKSGLTIDNKKFGERLGCTVITVHPRTGDGLCEVHEALNQPKRQQVTLPQVEDHVAVNKWANDVIASSVGGTLSTGTLSTGTLTDRLDAAFTHPILGLFVFAAVMSGLFWAIFTLATIPMGMVDVVFSFIGSEVRGIMPEGALRDLLVDGVINGVAGTVVFLPQICLLFFLISLLEDTGYLARAAFVMDRLLRKFGLPGQSFVPFLSAHACAIPAIMAARIVPDRRDRLATILVAPFFSCSARLPVYVLLISVLFAGRPFLAGVAFFGCYVLGAGAAFFTAFILRRTILPGASRPMMLELPTYKLPSLRTAVLNTIDRAWVFLKNAGTVILGIVVVLWWLTAYPKVGAIESVTQLREQAQAIRTTDVQMAEQLENEAVSIESSTQLEGSFAGDIGKFAEPLFRPLGFDWKLSIGVMTSFAAREVFVSTLAVLSSGSHKVDDPGIIDKIEHAQRDDGTPLFNIPTSASLLVFFVLAMQCLPTIAVTSRETGSWKWALLQLSYMSVLAWVAAFITYNVTVMLVQ